MKIILKCKYESIKGDKSITLESGDSIDLPKAEAERMIADGYAVLPVAKKSRGADPDAADKAAAE